MPNPITLRNLSGLPAAPAALAESVLVLIDCQNTYREGVMALSGVEAALDEALVAIDRAASPRHEPLRIYQREFQRLRRLTAEEEVQLAKDMEAALDVALDALATWPDGIARTLAAGAETVAGSRQLSSIWVGGEPDPEPASDESLEAAAPAPAEPEETADEDGDLADAGSADAGGAAPNGLQEYKPGVQDRRRRS